MRIRINFDQDQPGSESISIFNYLNVNFNFLLGGGPPPKRPDERDFQLIEMINSVAKINGVEGGQQSGKNLVSRLVDL